MGKRKSSKKPQGPKRRDPLPTLFMCLFCNHDNAVSVKLDKKAGVGTLECKICGQKFQCGINYLSAAVDVYSEWVDAADAVAQEAAAEAQATKSSSQRAGASSRRIDEDLDDRGYEGEGVVGDDEDYD